MVGVCLLAPWLLGNLLNLVSNGIYTGLLSYHGSPSCCGAFLLGSCHRKVHFGFNFEKYIKYDFTGHFSFMGLSYIKPQFEESSSSFLLFLVRHSLFDIYRRPFSLVVTVKSEGYIDWMFSRLRLQKKVMMSTNTLFCRSAGVLLSNPLLAWIFCMSDTGWQHCASHFFSPLSSTWQAQLWRPCYVSGICPCQ